MSDHEWKKLADHNPQVGDVLENKSGTRLFVLTNVSARLEYWPDVWGCEPFEWFRSDYRVVSRANAKPQPDDFHQHEVLHTAHVLMDTWKDHVMDTVFMDARPDIAAKAEAAQSAMMEVYQAIGAADAKPQPDYKVNPSATPFWDAMTDYNDGKWHGWNGGECPVHPETEVEVVDHRPLINSVDCYKAKARSVMWRDVVIRFRVTKPHVEPKKPRDFYIVGHGEACFDTHMDAAEYCGDFGLEESEITHVREVTDD